MIIKSGKAYGFGSARERGVTQLSPEAKAAIEAGELVICDRPFPGQPYYVVYRVKQKRYYNHRLPTAEETVKIKAAGF